eukprot:m.306179 g.306179  ORF g.306179 m.306179 type:complete len:202 (+) comp41024_c0_seq1:203-808(+)
MASPEEPAPAPEAVADDDVEETPGYKAPAQKSLEEIQQLDADDESLVRYKQTLLGNLEAAAKERTGPNVVVEKLRMLPTGEGDPKEMDLTGDLSKLKLHPIVIKEGCEYRIEIQFKVNYEIVSGLKYVQKTSKAGLTVDSTKHMVGSYGPREESYKYVTPVEEAPKGMMARMKYKVKSLFTDDDKNIYKQWEWSSEIKKTW